MSKTSEPISRSLIWEELREIVRLTRRQVMNLEKQGKFPRRIKTGGHRVVWSENQIRAWMEERQAGA